MWIPRRGSSLLLLTCALVAAAGPAGAGRIEGVAFAERVRAGDGELVLAGLGLHRYRVLFRAYVAALYLPEGTPPERVLQDVPKRLEIEYFWDVDGDAFAPAGESILARSLPAATLAALRPGLDAIGSLYVDVAAGDRYALTYVPGRGTQLSRNGVPLGVVQGADFAAAYFGIWLGDDPIDASLRDQLLGGRGP